MKRILIFFSLICCFGTQDVFAKITRTHSLSLIEAALRQADSCTLAIFDVGDVLITPKDQILQTPYYQFAEKFEKELERHYSVEEVETLQSILWMARLGELVDRKLPQLIDSLQKRDIKVLALTNLLTGSFGNLASPEDWRVGELEAFGYTFKDSWRGLKPKLFGDLKTKHPKRFPIFKKGVLFTCGLPKGPVLKAFLQYAELSPKKIIFVDDQRKYLESVEAFCKEAKISFEGFEYTAIVDRPKAPFNEKRAQRQFEVLQRERKWLSDKEAN